MTEKELIGKIQELRQIKPRKDWVVLTKGQILGEEKMRTSLFSFIEVFPRLIFQYKPAFATLAILGVLIGLFGFAQSSVPGDLLYSFKKATEQSQKAFVSEKEFNIKIANNRLDDLAKIVQNNSTKNLAPALNEYKASISEVAKNLAEENNPNELKKIVKEVKNIEKKTIEMKSLGVEMGEDVELDSALVVLIKLQVQDLGNRTLTPEQVKSLGEIKADIEAGKYSEALEKILEISQNQ